MRDKRRRSRRERTAQEEAWLLERELEETGRRLQQAYDAFNLASDPDLIEAWVYEVNAQRSKYAYLLKLRKAAEPEPHPENEVRA